MAGIEVELPEGGGRLDWIDMLRGVAILLVLVWHASAVPALFGWEMPAWLKAANNSLLPFRMPMLMFLSGLLLPKAFAKDWREYYIGKVRTLVWPYLLWAIVYIAQYGSRPPLTSWRAWYAVGYLWFLFFITVYYVIAPLVARLPAWLSPWVFMVGSIPLAAGTEKRLLYFGTFFFLGYWFAVSPRLRARVRGRVIPAAGALALGWGVVSAVRGVGVAYRGEFAAFSVCGILAAAWLAQRLGTRRALAFVGRNSIVYYVAHFPLMTWVVLTARALGMEGTPWIFLVNLVVGLLGATALSYARRRPIASWMFVMPLTLISWARRGTTSHPPSPRVASGSAPPGSLPPTARPGE